MLGCSAEIITPSTIPSTAIAASLWHVSTAAVWSLLLLMLALVPISIASALTIAAPTIIAPLLIIVPSLLASTSIAAAAAAAAMLLVVVIVVSTVAGHPARYLTSAKLAKLLAPKSSKLSEQN
jgi:hypothetical protein